MRQTSGSRAARLASELAVLLPAAVLWLSLFSPAATPGGAARSAEAQTKGLPPQTAANAKPGSWRPSVVGSPYGPQNGLDPSQIKAIYDKLEGILDVFGETAVLKSPVGFEAAAYYNAGKDVAVGAGRKNQVLIHSLSIFLFDYLQSCPTCPIEAVGESRCQLSMSINNVFDIYGNWQNPMERDEQGPIYLEPIRVGTFAGFPLYKNGFVLITNGQTSPVWLPVSRERFVRAQISKWQNQIKKLKPPNDRTGRTTIAQLEAELAGMSPAERAAPAYVSGQHSSHVTSLSPANDPGARALVATNPSFFDLTRPITSFQMAVLTTYPGDLLDPHPREQGFIWQKLLDVFKQADWKRVAALLQ